MSTQQNAERALLSAVAKVSKTMAERINKTYKPAELEAAIEVLRNNHYHSFSQNDAHGIVIALYNLGYRIVYTGDPEQTK